MTNMIRDDKIKVLLATHGKDALAFLIMIWSSIYENSYFIKWDNRERKLFCSDYSFKIETVDSIVQTCVDEGLFDRKILEKYKILTSRRIQSTWVSITSRRDIISFVKEYMLLDEQAVYKSHRIQYIDKDDPNKIIKQAKVDKPKKETPQKVTPELPKSDFVVTPDLVGEDIDRYRNQILEQNVLDFWALNAVTHHKKLVEIVEFLTVIKNTGRVEFFMDQLEAYKAFKRLTGIHLRHALNTFLGKQENRFEDGIWIAENWPQKLIDEQTKKSNLNGTSKNSRSNGQPDKYTEI